MGSKPAMMFKSLKAHASRHVLLTLAVAMMIPGSAAFAQTKAPVFTPAAGWQVNAGQLSQVRGLKQMKLPCVLSTEYDNGYVVRFSGGGNEMLALAIDFRQDVFKQGRQYDAMISLGGSYVKQVKASAFSQSTLIFNLRPLPDFYNAAQNGGEMEIEIDGNIMKFALGRIGAAYPQLEGCYKGEEAAPVKPITTQTASKAPVAAVESEAVDVAEVAAPQPLLPEDVAAKPLPRNFNDIVRNADAENETPTQRMKLSSAQPRPERISAPKQPAQSAESEKPANVTPRANTVSRAEPAVPAAKPAAPAMAAAPVSITPEPAAPASESMAVAQVSSKTVEAAPVAPPVKAVPPVAVQKPAHWEAKAGEDMKIVLSRWAERAGYDLEWQSDQNGKVAQDVKVSGSFEDAVGQLLAENSAATGIGAHVETTQGAKKDLGPKVSRVAAEPAPSAPPVKASIPALHEEWSAAPGSNIQTVLNQWSSKAGVAIVWQSYMNVSVKQPLNVTGTYEQAVHSLLDQYMNDSRRPIGQLNIDPETGARTLLMDISG